MLYLIRLDLQRPEGMSRSEFQEIWHRGAAAIREPRDSGAIQSFKVVGRWTIFAIAEFPGNDALDEALSELGGAAEIEVIPIRSYDETSVPGRASVEPEERVAVDHGLAGQDAPRENHPITAKLEEAGRAPETIGDLDARERMPTDSEKEGPEKPAAVDRSAQPGVDRRQEEPPASISIRRQAASPPAASPDPGTLGDADPPGEAPVSDRQRVAEPQKTEEAYRSEDGRYVLEKLLGSGMVAEVYLARDRELDRDVAFKVLRQQYAQDEELVERFRREAKSAASLSHPNIVSIQGRGETREGAYYIVMEYVSGGSLGERIRREGKLETLEAVSLALQTARALGVAHERGVVHRDVKPRNVLLTGSGEAKVTDFGIAYAASASTITQEGTVMGTPHYVSPEQALGQPVSPRSDLYSLGVVLYEMLTGKVPHDARTPVEIIMKHVSGYLRPPREVNPEVPEGLNAVVVRLLARNSIDRYQDAGELVGDLEQVLDGTARDPER